MKVEEWFEKNKFKSTSFSNIKRLVDLKKKQNQKISLCIPTLNEEATIGHVIDILIPLLTKYKLLDEIVVIDSGSIDRTKEITESKGVRFVSAANVLKKYGDIKGKGENLWKSLYVCSGDIIVWVDADIKNIHPRFVYGLVGPLLTHPKLGYVKGFYQRPIRVGKELAPLGGGRVTELTIRPLFNMYFPRLSGFIQPLSGEYAGRRGLLEKIPFFTGYGVETGMLIDITKKFGLNSMAQVDLIKRVHRNSPLASLSNMAFGILQVFAKRANALGKLILVKKIKHEIRIIEHTDKGNYIIKPKTLQDVERPPMIIIDEYRKKFKKDPSWVYV
ncbi:glucosyl-3-phosphoglycerate synthase [Candidatus Woesearchaeota archaeon]|nr:glucosyl-3-phosphoglycerate synthase [Candidatus Woesearchaeota archaeon]